MSLLTVKDILVKKEAINLPSCTFGSFKCHQCRYFEQESVDSQGKSRCSYHYTWHLPNDGCGSAEPSDFYYEDEIADYEGKCGNCREAFVSDEKYCSFCGTKRGEGEFKPYRNIVQTLYGPAPKPYKRLCKSCGYTWGAVLMFDHQKYCPRCGGNVERLSDEQGEKRLLKKNKKVLVLAFGVAVIAILLLASILYFFHRVSFIIKQFPDRCNIFYVLLL